MAYIGLKETFRVLGHDATNTFLCIDELLKDNTFVANEQARAYTAHQRLVQDGIHALAVESQLEEHSEFDLGETLRIVLMRQEFMDCYGVKNHPGSEVSFSGKIASDLYVRTHQGVFYRYLFNVVSNAIQASGWRSLVRRENAVMFKDVFDYPPACPFEGGPEVDVGVYVEGDFGVVYVSDNGPGIDESFRNKIYEPGVSGRGSSGLGLMYLGEIVDRIGVEIEIQSEKDLGACFTFRIPLAESYSR